MLFSLQCIVESVSIMDIICSEDPSYVYRGFPCIKALYGRLSADLAFARVLLPIAQFYLNHSECAAACPQTIPLSKRALTNRNYRRCRLK